MMVRLTTMMEVLQDSHATHATTTTSQARAWRVGAREGGGPASPSSLPPVVVACSE